MNVLRGAYHSCQARLADGRGLLYKEGMFTFRPYQWEVFQDHTTGILILHWSRQIGKTTTLAAWALERILRYQGHTVTLLSNSLRNGAEFIERAARFCENRTPDRNALKFKITRHEIRLLTPGGPSRILALAANPRTARGFSGDLVLDEFAHCEDIAGVWDAAEPILSSHPSFLCRIASTGNGRNLFYRMVQDPRFALSRVTRTDAWKMGVPILDPLTRRPITPEEARAAAIDKDSYDQNYECRFIGEAQSLLSGDLIERSAEAEVGIICSGDWSPEALQLLEKVSREGAPLFAGVDVGRRRDRTVITVVQSARGGLWLVRSILRLEAMRMPDQQKRLATLLSLPRLLSLSIDMTGIGLGLYEYSRQAFGAKRIQGVNFASTVPASRLALPRGAGLPQLSGREPTVRVTESLATYLLRLYEENRIRHPLDPILAEDLRLPRRVVTPSGQVSISAGRDESGLAGHADHFWSLALALDAAQKSALPSPAVQVVRPTRLPRLGTARRRICF